MTNTEAIETLRANYPDACYEQLREAVDAAIEALKAQNGTDTNVGSNDLISRQTLQKELALYPIDDVTSEDEAGYNRAINDIQKMVLHLPSAQPEPHYDEWCTDCKEYDHERHCCPRWNKVIKQTVEDLKGADRKWIPCSERLPEVEERVLVTDDSGGARTVDTDRLGQYEWSHDTFWYYSQNVVAWMPFPEPYEGEK